jgi:AraC-like DNA-binding protein
LAFSESLFLKTNCWHAYDQQSKTDDAEMELAMHRVVVSTDAVPEAERFAYWREEISERLIGVVSELERSAEANFSGRLVGSISGSLMLFRYSSDGCPVVRRPRDIARRSWDNYFMLYRERSTGAWFEHNQREFVTRVGDLAIADPTIPFATEPRLNYDHQLCFLPRRLLESYVPLARAPRNLVLPGSNPLASIVSAYLDAIDQQIDNLDDGAAGLVADNFCRLLAIACGRAMGDHEEPLRLARLEEAKRYVSLHLANPTLTPEKAAAALKISVRQLHILFEPSGSSFAQYVSRCRLEECRAALLNPLDSRSVTEIAFGWGFNSLRTFHRNFRQYFGATAGELRWRATGNPPDVSSVGGRQEESD